MRKIIFAALFAVTATVANAEVMRVNTVQPTVAGSPDGFVVNDVLIDFSGQLFGQQMVLQLDSGSVFQETTFGGESAPNGALAAVAPSILSDTFVTVGGAVAAESEGILVVGGSTELGLNGPKQIDTTGINIAWAPGTGIVVDGGTDYMTARVTLSDDASGNLFYYGNAGGNGVSFAAIPVANGVIGGDVIPEPSTCVLAGLALVGFVSRRK